jgi:predicted transcriptional regulator
VSGEVPPGLVESKARQRLARVLNSTGPRTARELAEYTGRSIAESRYHLRVLATAGAVTPLLTGAARGDELAYALTPEKLPEPARAELLRRRQLRSWR